MNHIIKQQQKKARNYLGTSPTQLNGTDYLADNIPVQKLDNLITQTVERTVEAVVEMCEGMKPRNDIDIFYKYEGESNGQNKLKEAIYKSGYTRALDDLINSLRTDLLGNEKEHQSAGEFLKETLHDKKAMLNVAKLATQDQLDTFSEFLESQGVKVVDATKDERKPDRPLNFERE
jgi:hypothetical protein